MGYYQGVYAAPNDSDVRMFVEPLRAQGFTVVLAEIFHASAGRAKEMSVINFKTGRGEVFTLQIQGHYNDGVFLGQGLYYYPGRLQTPAPEEYVRPGVLWDCHHAAWQPFVADLSERLKKPLPVQPGLAFGLPL